MLTIQDVGTEILGNTPRKFYVFGGSEYGIKCKYLDILKEHYGKYEEYQSVNDVLKIMSTMHIIPLEPMLYIVRYDESFVSNLSDQTEKQIDSANIIGTVVCIYESDKHMTKLYKFLQNYTVKIDSVGINFKIKYLHTDFPKLPDKLINLAAQYGTDYNDAKNMCRSMSMVDVERIFLLSDKQILALFGKQKSHSVDDLKIAIATKNFNYLVNYLETVDDYDSIFYTILSTMVELEKILSNSKYVQSNLKDYAKYWFESDIYNMFMNTYEEIRKLRSYATDAKLSLIYLFGLMRFKHIPSLEFMEMEE